MKIPTLKFEEPIFEMPESDLVDWAGGCFDSKGTRFAMTSGNEARLFDLEQGVVLQRWHLADGRASQMQMDAQGRWLLLRRENAAMEERSCWRLYELSSAGQPILLHEQKETNWSAHGMALAPGGERFLVWHRPVPGEGGNVVIRAYAVADGRELWHQVTEVEDPELRVVFDPGGHWFGHDGEVSHRLSWRRWSDFVEVGKAPPVALGYYQAIAPFGEAFAGNGSYFPDVTGMKNGIPFAADWTPLSWVSAFSPDGRFLAQGTEDGVVLVLDIPEVKRRLTGLW
ncbi:MAG: hypothetical protein EXS31_05950 [Pedosphaera sp.]|nr:hypothetical protein [Pedosphaera sp.]